MYNSIEPEAHLGTSGLHTFLSMPVVGQTDGQFSRLY